MKTLVIDAINGVGFPTLTVALTAEQAGMADFKLDLFGSRHVWNRDKLEALPLKELQMMYEGLRAEREVKAEPLPEAPVWAQALIQTAGEAH